MFYFEDTPFTSIWRRPSKRLISSQRQIRDLRAASRAEDTSTIGGTSQLFVWLVADVEGVGASGSIGGFLFKVSLGESLACFDLRLRLFLFTDCFAPGPVPTGDPLKVGGLLLRRRVSSAASSEFKVGFTPSVSSATSSVGMHLDLPMSSPMSALVCGGECVDWHSVNGPRHLANWALISSRRDIPRSGGEDTVSWLCVPVVAAVELD